MDVQTANTALQQIAQINQQLEGASTSSGSSATLEDQRDQDITQLTQLMNVNVMQDSNNQISVFTGTGQQLVAGPQASQLQFDNAGTLSATALWSANPSQDGAGTITLVSPGGATTDLIATNAIQSGQLGAYVQMRDTILPQAQTQLDELANQMSQALSNQTTNGTAVTSGSQSGFSVDVGSVLPGNSVQLTYTDSSNVQHTITVVSLGAGGTLPAQDQSSNPDNQCCRHQFFRRHGLGRNAAQRRARGEPAIFQSIRHRLASAQQRQRQCCQFAIGHLDPDLAHQRQRAAATVHGRE